MHCLHFCVISLALHERRGQLIYFHKSRDVSAMNNSLTVDRATRPTVELIQKGALHGAPISARLGGLTRSV